MLRGGASLLLFVAFCCMWIENALVPREKHLPPRAIILVVSFFCGKMKQRRALNLEETLITTLRLPLIHNLFLFTSYHSKVCIQSFRYYILLHHNIVTIIMDNYRKKSAIEAKAILESGISTLDALTSALSSMPYNTTAAAGAISQAESAFIATIGGDVEMANGVVDAAYKITRDALVLGSAHTRTLERFVGLHIPQVEVR